MAKILGLPFDDYVKNQIEVRQKKLAKTQKSSEDLVVFNSNTSWVRLSSGVKIEADRAKTLSDKLGISTSLIQGNALSRNLVLWGGISSFTPGTETATLDSLKGGVGYGLNNAYGFLSNSSQGLQPPPGIESISCNYKNNGSLKQAQVKLKCFTRSQFEALEAVYLRLGYAMVLEWGNTIYFDNNETFSQITKYSIPNLLFNKEGDVDPATLSSQIQSNKVGTGGNYEGMVGKVTNYSWNLQEDLSYSITIDLISVGDIIDSLKANIGGSSGIGDTSSLVNVSGSIENLVSILVNKNSSRINAFLYELYDEIYKDALSGWQVSGATQEEIQRANKIETDIDNGEPKTTQKAYTEVLKEFRKYYELFNEALEIYKKGTIDYTGTTFLNSSKATSEEQTRYFKIVDELFATWPVKSEILTRANAMFNREAEKTDGVDKYKGCLDTIENFIKGLKLGEDDFNKVQSFNNKKGAIINALDRGWIGFSDNFVRVEGSEYDDGVGDYIFTLILEHTFKIDG